MKYEYTASYIINYVFFFFVYSKIGQTRMINDIFLSGHDHSSNITTLKLRPHTKNFDELNEQSANRFEPLPSSMVGSSPFHQATNILIFYLLNMLVIRIMDKPLYIKGMPLALAPKIPLTKEPTPLSLSPRKGLSC